MKKLFLCILFFSFPYSAFAGLDIYLSSQKLPYENEIWTSSNFPDAGASKIQIEQHFYREDVPSDYDLSAIEIQNLIYDLFPTFSQAQKSSLYNSLLSFDTQNFLEYIGIALSPDTESNISEKQINGIILTPFESTFQACGINLTQRETITKTLLQRIQNGDFSKPEDIQYSTLAFGDCIIPFPDTSRGGTLVANSFPSNKLIARSTSGNPLRFGTLEDSVNLISLTDVTLGGTYTGVQSNNLLHLQSTRIENTQIFDKEVGGNKILFVHQNYSINPFKESYIIGNDISGYNVGGAAFNPSNSLYINSTDTEEERIFSQWKEIEPGVYMKTLIQENTYEIKSGKYIPKQNVGVTSYYAIVYNYDTTPPVCETSLFSHDSAGNENFIFPEYPWFRTSKYGYFVCGDDESGCRCTSSDIGCFSRSESILSIPKVIPHLGSVQYTFYNNAGLSQVCQSGDAQKLFYDRISPDIKVKLPGILESSLVREYVSNKGVLYDGVHVPEKRFYNITNQVLFQANNTLDIKLELFDTYNSSKIQEGVSGLHSYSLHISKFENENWIQKIQEEHTFTPYNPLGTLKANDTFSIDLKTLSGIDEIVTKVGTYQVYVDVDDAAGNQSRVIFYFTIIPGPIDTAKSTLQVIDKNTLYANNTSTYFYTLTLRDAYLNPIGGQKVGSIVHSCLAVSNCSELRIDMTGTTPSGQIAIEVNSFDTLSDSEGKIDFQIRSVAPGIFTESFHIDFIDPNISLRFAGGDNNFLKPVSGVFEVQEGGNWFSDRLPIEQASKFRILIQEAESKKYNWNLSDFSSYLHARHPDTSFVLSGALDTKNNGVYFSGTFKSHLSEIEKHKTLLEVVHNGVSGIIVSYTLSGKTIKYYLSGDTISQNALTLTDTRELQNPVQVIGSLQGIGNTHNTAERQNITDINTAESRNIFRKNVGSNIKARQNNTIVGGIKYIDKTNDSDKNYVLERNPGFETLVVRNGNILISNDFNTSGDIVGLISYMDASYNTKDGYKNIGNIYVESEVKTINAVIYTDGALVSTQSGIPISGDISSRNTLLQNQLSLRGALFTRNTLAGGKELAGEYMLPGGKKTSDQPLAILYDLYYTRRGNNNCTKDIYDFCNIPQYLIIDYDTRIISSPPKLFSF